MLPEQLQYDLSRGREDIVFFAETFLGLKLHDGQKEYLRNATEKINLLISANRWGKSVLMAVLHIHHTFYKIGLPPGNAKAWSRAEYMTANLAPHSDATEPVFKAIIALLNSAFPIPQEDGGMVNNECTIGHHLDRDRIRNSKPLHIRYTNKSETLFRSLGEDKGTSIQGKNFGIITYDEGGRSHHLRHEINSNIMPRLADLNGNLHIPSTPDMESPSILDHFDMYEKGKRRHPGYYSQSGSIEQNLYLLRNNPTYIEDEKKRLRGNPILKQVLYGEFVFGGAAFYPTADIQKAQKDELVEGIPYEPGREYIIGTDTAMGNADELVHTILRVPLTDDEKYVVVKQVGCKGNEKSPELHVQDFVELVYEYWDDQRTNLKHMLETWDGSSGRFYLDLPPDIQAITTCWGSWQPPYLPSKIKAYWRTVKKTDVLLSTRKLMAKGLLDIPNEQYLVRQLSIYREDDKGLKTDRVISLALACWMATDGRPKVTEIELVEAPTW